MNEVAANVLELIGYGKQPFASVPKSTAIGIGRLVSDILTIPNANFDNYDVSILKKVRIVETGATTQSGVMNLILLDSMSFNPAIAAGDSFALDSDVTTENYLGSVPIITGDYSAIPGATSAVIAEVDPDLMFRNGANSREIYLAVVAGESITYGSDPVLTIEMFFEYKRAIKE
jgi:hypothetical protein